MEPLSIHNLHLVLSLALLLLLGLEGKVLTQVLTSPSDLSALKAFKASINPRSIPPWSCLASWDFSAADPCASPRRTHFVCGLTCSPDSARVTQLTLDSVGYSGPLTPLISRLTLLTTLDLADNSFYGPIPRSISSLDRLATLTLSFNAFSGRVPDSLTRLTSLESLDLSYNSLTGPLPRSMNALTKLRRLDLSYNKLTGSIPKLPRNLVELALKANWLSGVLAEYSFVESTQLEIVELSENSFTGTLGAWFFRLPAVQQVDLANNSLTRIDVPQADQNSELVALELGFNQIRGYAPAALAAYPRLASLSMRHNRLRGPIPLEYGKSRNIRRLFLDGNFLRGEPPAGFLQPDSPISGSVGDNCLRECPTKARMCAPLQKPYAVCREAYGRKPKP